MHSTAQLGKTSEATPDLLPTTGLPLPAPERKRGTAAHFRLATVLCEVFADLGTITLAVTLGYFIYDSLRLGKHLYYPISTVMLLAFVFAIGMVLMPDRVGAYRQGNSLLRVRETEQVLRVSTQALLIVLAVSFFTSVLFSRWLLVLCMGLVPLLLFAQKSLTYMLLRFFHARGYGNEGVLIYGSGSTGRRVFSVLQRSPRLGLEPLAFVDDDPAKTGNTIYEMGYERRRSAPVVRGPVTRELVAKYGADLVLIAIPSIGRERFAHTLEEAFSADARVSFVPSHLLATDPWVDYQDIDGVLLASFGRPARRIAYESVKRVCDVLGSLILMVLGTPVFLLLALAIKLDSKGPVLFRQERVGLNGKRFRMFKFRTMHANAPTYEYSPQVSADPRITRLGKFLRQTSLDEVPQLLNVLQGHMSLVGPRPEMPFIVEQYTDRHRQRLQVRPGLTGLWQLSGDRAFLIHENVEYDLYYIRHRSFFMDVAILLHTIIFAARGI
jgi:exopolysaccharide biosynthesis polyprenyl glycosylphosphotransferase